MRDRRTEPCAGFTVAELVITLFVFSLLVVAMLTLFDQSNKLARAQTNIAEMQQSLRIGIDEMVRNARIANRGWVLDPNLTVEVLNDPGGDIAADPDTTASDALEILPGTDVLVVLGVITGSLYEPTSGTTSSRQIVVSETSPSGITHDLTGLKDLFTGGNSVAEAVLIVSALGEEAVVELDPDSCSDDGDSVTLAFLTEADPGTRTGAYELLTTAIPTWLNQERTIRMIGVLEEYRYYVRANRVDPTDNTTDPQPRLSAARVFPGTEDAWDNDNDNLKIDIADDILDLQLTVGMDLYTIDTNSDGIDDEGDGIVTEVGTAADDDEWFYNFPGDSDPPAIFTGGELMFVRISVLARTHRREFRYVSPPIAAIEDNVYNELAANDPSLTDAQKAERSFHRRLLQSIADFRNI